MVRTVSHAESQSTVLTNAQSNTLLIAPPPSYATTHSGTTLSAPSAPGLPDTLRARNTLTAPSTQPAPAHQQSTHPLEARLRNWNDTQAALRATLLRRQFGIAAPVMRAMELADCVAGEESLLLGGVRAGGRGGVHGDVLRGEDWEVGGWEGVYDGAWGSVSGMGVGGEFHAEMEGQLGMRW